MSDQQELIQAEDAQTQAGTSAEDAVLLDKINKLEKNNLKLLTEKKNTLEAMAELQRTVEQLQQQDQKREQQDLLANGKADVLVEQLRGTVGEKDRRISELEQQLQQRDVEFQQQQIKSAAINAFSQNGVHSPEDLFHLEQNNLRLKDGAVVALTGGIEVPLQQHVEALKSSGSGRDYFFSGSGARGMSAAGSSNSASGGNSWGSMGLMQRIQMEEENPQLAAQLKAQG